MTLAMLVHRLVWGSLIVGLTAAMALAAHTPAGPSARPPLPDGLRLGWNGTFQPAGAPIPGCFRSPRDLARLRVVSASGTGGMRRLQTMALSAPGRLPLRLPEGDWMDARVADDGHVALLGDPDAGGPTSLLLLDPQGREIWSGAAARLQDAAFSADGTCFSFVSGQGTRVVDLRSGSSRLLPVSLSHATAAGGSWVLLAENGGIGIWRDGARRGEVAAVMPSPRALALDPGQDVGAVADAGSLVVFDLSDGRLRFQVEAPAGRKYRDLRCAEGRVLAGLQARARGRSEGWLYVLDLQGTLRLDSLTDARELPVGHHRGEPATRERTDSVPWPFSPFDSMRTVWNGYEQHMGDGSSTWSYLHQGLDLITPIAEPVFAVDSGFVKCVLTLGGDSYWRTAISAVQTADTSLGWLYAHLDPASIVIAAGDTVATHDFLGEIVWWSGDWGHIHFVEIRDQGMVWQYADDQWGITGNPLPRLEPHPDEIAPSFVDVLDGRRFAFCRNNSATYLDPQDLWGAVDVVVQVVDQVGPSEWQQPPHSVHWWLRDLARDSLVIAPRLAHVLDHAYPFYAVDNFIPWATVLYKRDEMLFPGTWMDPERRYHMVLTNSDGDSLLEQDDEEQALLTSLWPDGPYRIVAEAADAAGNTTRDSLDVVFHNGTALGDAGPGRPQGLQLSAWPNPFNPSTLVRLELAQPAVVELRLFDLCGRQVREWRPGRLAAGVHELRLEGNGLASGIYFCQVRAGAESATLRLLLLR